VPVHGGWCSWPETALSAESRSRSPSRRPRGEGAQRARRRLACPENQHQRGQHDEQYQAQQRPAPGSRPRPPAAAVASAASVRSGGGSRRPGRAAPIPINVSLDEERLEVVTSSTGAPGGKRTGDRVGHYIVAGGPFDLACRTFLAKQDGLLGAIARLSRSPAAAVQVRLPEGRHRRVGAAGRSTALRRAPRAHRDARVDHGASVERKSPMERQKRLSRFGAFPNRLCAC
jgi:hypothetical protein